MNILQSTATLAQPAPVPTTRSDVASTATVGSTTSDGTAKAGDGTLAARGFGSMLTKHLDEAGSGVAAGKAGQRPRGELDAKLQADAKVDAKADPKADPKTAAAADPSAPLLADGPAATVPAVQSDAASGAADVAPQELFPTLAAPSGKAAVAPGSAAPDGARKGRADDDRVADGAAGSDLAAQLALASQWTGVAKPVDPATVAPTPTTTAVAATGVASGSVGPHGASGRDRALAGKAAPIAGRAVMPSNEGANDAANGAAIRAADTTTGQGAGADDARQGDARGTPAGNASIVATKDDAKTRDALALTVVDATIAAGAGTQAPVDGDAFALRLAAHVTSVPVTVTVTTSTAATASPSTTDVVREPVGSPAWSHEVGQAALRIATNDLQSASLRLNPEHLGPLDVQVRVDNGVAHVAFTATHVDTQQALEASRGTLDQLFTSQGLKMGEMSVGSGSSNGSNDASAARGDQAPEASRRDGGRWSGNDSGTDGDATVKTVTTRIARALGLVDTFA